MGPGPNFRPPKYKVVEMDNIIYLSDRNRIVEEHLHCIDTVIGQNWPLIRATRLERDDVYQQLAIRLIRCVEKHDAQKGSLEKYIYTSLKYELLSCVKPRPLTGITGAPKDFRRGNVVSINAIRENSGLFQDYMAA